MELLLHYHSTGRNQENRQAHELTDGLHRLLRIRRHCIAVSQVYAQAPMGSLPPHKFVKYTKTHEDYLALPETTNNDDSLHFSLEVYMDDFIGAAAAKSLDDNSITWVELTCKASTMCSRLQKLKRRTQTQ